MTTKQPDDTAAIVRSAERGLATRSSWLFERGLRDIARIEGLQADDQRRHLWDAVNKGDAAEVESILKAAPTLANACDTNGQPLIHLAVWCGNHQPVTEALVAYGADIEQRDKYGYTPLIVAAEACCWDTVEFLIARGADVHARTHDGRTPLIAAVDCIPVIGGVDCMPCTEEHVVTMVELLLRSGADVSLNEYAKSSAGRTALHWAAMSDMPRVIALLVGHGARAEAEDAYGSTPLDLAVECGKEANAAILRAAAGAP